ncbi:hypothetical protein SAMN06296416_10628 [Pseudoxanthomonas wuyuanensis]|uniref:WG containing repeat-containing protein n=2 Tax=Pseudoxanthomonas wuyuanensis TaxID=1073196 RepID=A0A286D8S8_9GAMM|nr:hypothetical protein [Pseudoxanthomonas wuyuanensis]KAF1718908.1 hypothetical protein CSC75_17530 [Pseudoxanthomonas wuyuanensis]SOD55065.1 hypothetical protein SAMN06296416_10628 [Pseudoxanthomonas wuyuanensis]
MAFKMPTSGRWWRLTAGVLLMHAGPALAAADTPAAGEARVFLFHASGFPGWGVADTDGRLVRAPLTPLRRVAPDRWLASDYDASAEIWLDDRGNEMARMQGADVEDEPLPQHPSGERDYRGALWPVVRNGDTSLVDANGAVAMPWQQGYGQWRLTIHPERIVWVPQRGPETILAWHGKPALQLGEDEMRVSGPFRERLLYWICDYARERPCQLRDEQGGVHLEGDWDDLRAMDDGRWLARGGNTWAVLDERGNPQGALRYLAGSYFPRLRSGASDRLEEDWPMAVRAFRFADLQAALAVVEAGGEAVEPVMTEGLLQRDGSFHPLPEGYGYPVRIVPGRWRVSRAQGQDDDGRIIDDRAAPVFALGHDNVQAVDGRPDVLVRYPQGGAAGRPGWSLVDRDGKVLFHHPAVTELRSRGPGFVGSLEGQRRIWVAADFRHWLLPPDSDIREVDAGGRLLLVATGETMRLFNTGTGGFVGAAFDHAEPPSEGWLVFNRAGYYGLMDADGNEALAPRYYQVKPWGADRWWSRGQLGEHEYLRLHGADGAVLFARRDGSLLDLPRERELDGVASPVASIVGKSYRTAQGSYFVQQWIDRQGQTVLMAAQCPGADPDSVLANGAGLLMGKGWPQPLYHGGECELPESVRAELDARPAEAVPSAVSAWSAGW